MEKTLIIILTRMITAKSYSLYHRYFRKIPIIFISDFIGYIEKDDIFYHPSEILEKEGFSGMTTFKLVSAWDKLIYHLKLNNNFEYYWIIEDDVYLNHQIENIILKNNYHDEDLLITSWNKEFLNNDNYYHWEIGKDYFYLTELFSSVNVLCRISKKLLETILDFQEENKKLLFHEILFISLVKKFNLTLKEITLPKAILYSTSLFKINDKQKLLEKINQDNINLYHPFKNWHNFIL
jgi:hypothetical protein